MNAPRPGRVHVLLIDDSAVVRELVQQLFQRDRTLSVTVAADPIIAMRKMQEARPDVILLDLALPRMDGLAFLRKVMSEAPIPVVIFSATQQADTVMQALSDGAVDAVSKPQIGIRDFLEDSYTLLVDAVRGAAGAKLVRRRGAMLRTGPTPSLPPLRMAPSAEPPRIVAVGASTGGTEALTTLLQAMPADAPGMAIVQHMPAGFTGAFAKRLDACCQVHVKEAAHGDRLRPGHVLIAPGNRHLVVRRVGGEYVADVLDAPLVSRHRPSVDILFRSVATAAGASGIGVLLTGMGADGAEGLLEMKRSGAATLAQDEASSVVFGMPKEAIARGAVDVVLPIDRIAGAVLHRAASGRAAPASVRFREEAR